LGPVDTDGENILQSHPDDQGRSWSLMDRKRT